MYVYLYDLRMFVQRVRRSEREAEGKGTYSCTETKRRHLDKMLRSLDRKVAVLALEEANSP